MVTLIIPTLNEEKTVRQVIELAGQSSLVDEILIIDDKSYDDTLKVAKLKSVKLYTSTMLGKGTSMREGMLLAKNEIILYLDEIGRASCRERV